MFDYDTWLSTPPEPPGSGSIWELDEYLDRAYEEWKDNVAMGYEQRQRKTKEEKKMTNKLAQAKGN